ncbi:MULTISPECIES: RNA polymerase sigma factor [Streptomyces]
MPDTEVRDRVSAHGYRVLLGQIRSQRIYEACRGVWPHISPTFDELETLRASADERHALASQTLIAVLEQRVQPWDTWDAGKGAALETWFVGALHLQFPTVFERWRKARLRRLDEHKACAAVIAAKGAPADPALGAVTRDELERALRTAEPEVRSVLALVAAGYRHDEIADHLRLSERGVEGRIYRFRRSMRNPVRGTGKKSTP